MCEISIVIPVRDEEKNLDELVTRIFNSLEMINKSFEIIFITDINKDNTVQLLEDYSKKYSNVKAIKLSNGFGQHVAVMAGLDYASGEAIVIMDGDLQDCPEDIPLLYNKLCENFDIVYGIKERKNENVFRNSSSRLFNWIMNLFSDKKVSNNSSMFRIISRKALNEIVRFREYEPSLTYIFSYINLPTAKIAVTSGTRHKGETKYNFIKLFSFAVSSLLSFSRKPLRMISILGLVMSLLSFLYLIIVLFQYLFLKIEVQGWATMVVVSTLIGGIQLLSLGVIGEYIGRMYMQTKNRPLYIIERKIGKFD